jgi:hypothetical protein
VIDKPVWLEEWKCEANEKVVVVFDRGGVSVASHPNVSLAEDRLILAAAAPALVRALLMVEWHRTLKCPEGVCVVCNSSRKSGHGVAWTEQRPQCDLNVALTAAGFPDQASRDAARERMRR